MEVRVLENLSSEELEKDAMEILSMIREVFPAKIAEDYTFDWLKEKIVDKRCINIVAFDENQVIKAYLLTMPLSEAREDMISHGVKLDKDANDEKYYIDTLISTSHQRIFVKMINTMMRIAWKQGKKTICMHARIHTGFADIVMTIFPVELIRVDEDFMGYGEPFGYMEGELDNVTWLRAP